MKIPLYLDPFLIQLYRITGHIPLDYFLGTFLLALATVVIGDISFKAVFRFNRRHIQETESEMMKKHTLSLTALKMADKQGYKAVNQQANEAFGLYFFTMIAQSAALLWPIPFALTWMQYRFRAVKFPLVYPLSQIWPATGYFTTFILCYILARILFKNLTHSKQEP